MGTALNIFRKKSDYSTVKVSILGSITKKLAFLDAIFSKGSFVIAVSRLKTNDERHVQNAKRPPVCLAAKNFALIHRCFD